MRPDRVIVGEVRGGEAIDMLQCFNTGHDGSISTAHANSARDILARLETMALMGMDLPLSAIQRQIASGVDIIIHLGRIRDRTRKILEIAEVCGYQSGEIVIQTLYQFQEQLLSPWRQFALKILLPTPAIDLEPWPATMKESSTAQSRASQHLTHCFKATFPQEFQARDGHKALLL